MADVRESIEKVIEHTDMVGGDATKRAVDGSLEFRTS